MKKTCSNSRVIPVHLEKSLEFPVGIYEYLVRKANSAVNEMFISISYPNVRIKFLELKRKGSWNTVDWLFSEIGKRLIRIKEKYDLDFGDQYTKKDVRLDFRVHDTYREIMISGFTKIPIKSFKNILTIVVWSWIVFSTGVKPNESETAQKMLDKFTKKAEEFQVYWNRKSRVRRPLDQPRRCYICGKEAKFLNNWKYEHNGIIEEVFTPVCNTHSSRII